MKFPGITFSALLASAALSTMARAQGAFVLMVNDSSTGQSCRAKLINNALDPAEVLREARSFGPSYCVQMSSFTYPAETCYFSAPYYNEPTRTPVCRRPAS